MQCPLRKDICPSESHEEEHCTVSELLQPETHEEEAEPASTSCVSNVQQPVTLLDIKEPKTSKRPVLNLSIINDFKELTIYDAMT